MILKVQYRNSYASNTVIGYHHQYSVLYITVPYFYMTVSPVGLSTPPSPHTCVHHWTAALWCPPQCHWWWEPFGSFVISWEHRGVFGPLLMGTSLGSTRLFQASGRFSCFPSVSSPIYPGLCPQRRPLKISLSSFGSFAQLSTLALNFCPRPHIPAFKSLSGRLCPWFSACILSPPAPGLLSHWVQTQDVLSCSRPVHALTFLLLPAPNRSKYY